MRCNFCLKQRERQVTWLNLFALEPLKGFCNACTQQLHLLDGPRCIGCSRESEAEYCHDCLEWEKTGNGLNSNHSVYAYNEYMKEMIYQWKYRGDYEVAFGFKAKFLDTFLNLPREIVKDALIVPLPLSKERLQERAFNQASMLASFLPSKVVHALERVHGEKQSKKTRKERIQANNPFIVTKKIEKPVILVDDIYTTGATLYQAATLLKEAGVPHVTGYTLIRG